MKKAIVHIDEKNALVVRQLRQRCAFHGGGGVSLVPREDTEEQNFGLRLARPDLRDDGSVFGDIVLEAVVASGCTACKAYALCLQYDELGLIAVELPVLNPPEKTSRLRKSDLL